jgi:hypothetical protein
MLYLVNDTLFFVCLFVYLLVFYSRLCLLTSIFNRQANIWISSSFSTCTSKCWLLGMFFLGVTFSYNFFFPVNHWTNHHKLFPWIQLSYIVVDLLIWWGMRSYINEFRKRKLKLPPIAYFSTYHGSISHLPTGYMWSSHLVPKPSGKVSI